MTDEKTTPERARMTKTATPGIYRRGNRYVLVWKFRGRQHKSSHRTLSEAREAKAQRQRNPTPVSRVRFDDYAASWLDTYRGRTKRGFTMESTGVSYRRALDDHLIPHFRGARLSDLGAADVRGLFAALERKGVSAAGVRGVKRVLSALMATAAEDGLVATNPCVGVRYVPARPPTLDEERAARERLRPLTRAEAAALLHAIPRDDDRLVIRFALSTGLRIGELVGLTWRNVDLGAAPKVLVREQVYKGQRRGLKTPSAIRDVPLSPWLADQLRALRRDDYVGEDAPVFATRAGTPRNPSAIAGRVLKPAARAIGLPWVHCHTLRRTAGSWLLQAGRTPVQVQRFLGHADPGFTLRSTYVGLVDEGVGDAVLFDAALDTPKVPTPSSDAPAMSTPPATQHPQDDAEALAA